MMVSTSHPFPEESTQPVIEPPSLMPVMASALYQTASEPLPRASGLVTVYSENFSQAVTFGVPDAVTVVTRIPSRPDDAITGSSPSGYW